MRRAATADLSSGTFLCSFSGEIFLVSSRREAPHTETFRTMRIQQLQRAHAGFANQSGNARQSEFQFFRFWRGWQK